MQWQAAEKGNPTMLIWLGKQYLGQSDKRELSGPDGGPVVEIPDPSTLSLEEITAYHEKLNKRVAKVVVAGLRREEEEAEQEPGGENGEE